MGFARTIQTNKLDREEFARLLKCSGGVHDMTKGKYPAPRRGKEGKEEEEEGSLVCVTSGVSCLGLAIVNCLLQRTGYSVRIAVDNKEDMEKLREMGILGEATSGRSCRVSVVMVKVTDTESLCDAFNGCHGVFHTSAFVDPAGVSGYTKYMADLEVKVSEKVMEACARTETVRKCVFTSSLLACVWYDNALDNLPPIIDSDSWSEESVCRDKKVWFALGKTMAERTAWRMAEDSEVKLATICPGFLTGPDYLSGNSISSIAYFKGAQEMYTKGLLATTVVTRVAEAHVSVYVELKNTSGGRYICFDRLIRTEAEATELACQMGIPPQRILGDTPRDSPVQLKLCNAKVLRLLSTQNRCSKIL